MPKQLTERDNFIWLLYALIALLFSGAVIDQYYAGNAQPLINASLTTTLLVAIWSLEKRVAFHGSRMGISTVFIALALGDVMLDRAEMYLTHIGFILTFLTITIYLAARQILFTGNVDSNKVIGAICIYMMMGLWWAFAYLFCEELLPGSLAGLQHKEWYDNMQTVVYYSFITLTTLGYGEITPTQPLTQFLAYMEAITGQFYIAILVASLIGIKLADRKH